MPSSLAGQTLLLMPDPHQTPLGVAGANSLERQAHGPYGHVAASVPAPCATGFNGQLREPQGVYQLGNGHRVYNPVLMRFHSGDDLSPFEKGGLNAYAYCLGDPLNFSDPSGRVAMELPSLLIGSLFDSPIAGLVHNTALLIGGIFTNLAVPPVGMAVVASATTIYGSLFGLAGVGLQFAGEKELGGTMSTIGLTVSSIASVTRVGLGMKKFEEVGPLSPGEILKRSKNMLFGGYKKSTPTLPGPPAGSAPLVRRYSAPAVLPDQLVKMTKRGKLEGELSAKITERRRSIGLMRRDSMFLGGMDAPGNYHKVNPREFVKITE